MIKTFARLFETRLLVGVLGAAIVLGLLGHLVPTSLRILYEAGMYLLLFLACASYKPLRAAFLGLDRYRRAFLGAFLLAAVLGQLAKSAKTTYPFSAWGMYANAHPSSEYLNFEAVLRSGATIPFPFTQVSPSTSSRPFIQHFTRRINRMRRIDDGEPGRDEALTEIEGLLSAVVAVYNRRHPRDPIRAVRADACSIPIDTYRDRSSIRCQRVLSLDIE